MSRLIANNFINSPFLSAENLTMENIDKLYAKIDNVLSEVHKVVVGQDYLINRLLVGLFTNGHILVEGVPGLAKTKTINTLSSGIAVLITTRNP